MDILIDTIQDTYLMIPLLLIMYLILEYLEHQNENKTYESYFAKYGPIVGAILGIVPQCGFSVMASLLFIEGKMTLGTLISIFIATSDEAIPLLIAHPQMHNSLLQIIMIKFVLSIVVGYGVDMLFKNKYYFHSSVSYHHEHHHIVAEALKRTFKIYSFIFVIHFGFTYLIDTLGQDTLSQLLMSQSILQPIISALFGFIPNCVASVVLTQLYIHQTVSFASLLAGLITNAGLGIIVLLQNHVQLKIILKIMFILLISALLISLPLQSFIAL